ncbi:MAG: hypothetical protein PHW18_03515 [Sulfuricurvum sp.]|uniref:hypothetical protein n=1 Tax=Sulfuricurvum sp. TaxID=2025608 RepID=UPI002602F041|nr:hypothetical protein [Sulfuricurvum sp.]MDD2828626.1 hypothetical protein [Sulfuricurvum sp.]MDD4948303.1 hypothetical protein [Sulfuricurvum sp.]
MSATLRKNFVFDSTVVAHLEEIAKIEGLSLTKAISEMIEQRYEEIAKQKRLEAAMSIVGSASGVFGNLTIQEIKAQMDV